ncbi:MAG: sulfotransferase domain-containing protein, partial [Chitinophagales bacterium]
NEEGRKSNLKEQKVYAYKQRSLYCQQLDSYFRHFPKQNFLFLIFEEDIVKNLDQTVRRVQQFLDLPYESLMTNVHSNEAFEARNEVVRDLVRKPNFAKKIFKLIMPSGQIRKKLRSFLIQKNAQAVSAPKLDPEVRSRLYNEMFKEDIEQTELLINKKLLYS